MAEVRIMPSRLVVEVEMYLDKQLAAAGEFTHREPLDDGGVYDLHTLAAAIYAAGWEDGVRAESERQRGQRRRDRAALKNSRTVAVTVVPREVASWCVADAIADPKRGNGVWEWTADRESAELVAASIHNLTFRISTPEHPSYRLPEGSVAVFPVKHGEVIRDA